MQITPDSLRTLRTAINMLFKGARTKAMPVWKDFASKVSSTTRTMHFPQTSSLQRLRRWDGERKVVNGKSYDYTVTHEKFELTAGIPVEEIEDDNVGAYNDMIEDMGLQSELWPDDLAFELLLRGENSAYPGFDGKAFFANDHELKSGSTIDNLIGSTALTKANLAAVIAQMMSWVGEDGRSLRVRPTLLAIPPNLEETARQILMGATIAEVFGSNTAAAAASNTMQGRLQYRVYPELATAAGGNDTSWYVFDTSRSTKPIVLAERKAPKLTFKNEEQDDNVFWDDEVIFGVRARGVAGWGPFHLGAKCNA